MPRELLLLGLIGGAALLLGKKKKPKTNSESGSPVGLGATGRRTPIIPVGAAPPISEPIPVAIPEALDWRLYFFRDGSSGWYTSVPTHGGARTTPHPNVYYNRTRPRPGLDAPPRGVDSSPPIGAVSKRDAPSHYNDVWTRNFPGVPIPPEAPAAPPEIIGSATPVLDVWNNNFPAVPIPLATVPLSTPIPPPLPLNRTAVSPVEIFVQNFPGVPIPPADRRTVAPMTPIPAPLPLNRTAVSPVEIFAHNFPGVPIPPADRRTVAPMTPREIWEHNFPGVPFPPADTNAIVGGVTQPITAVIPTNSVPSSPREIWEHNFPGVPFNTSDINSGQPPDTRRDYGNERTLTPSQLFDIHVGSPTPTPTPPRRNNTNSDRDYGGERTNPDADATLTPQDIWEHNFPDIPF